MKNLLIFIALLGLSACNENKDVTLHEPGVYKGKVDKHARTTAERDAILKKRFNMVQTDR